MHNHAVAAVAVAVPVALLFNFVPAIIAFASRHPERRRLAQINVLSIVSFVLWFALLAWAIGGKRDDGVINRFIGNPRNRTWLQAGVALLVGVGMATIAYAITRG